MKKDTNDKQSHASQRSGREKRRLAALKLGLSKSTVKHKYLSSDATIFARIP